MTSATEQYMNVDDAMDLLDLYTQEFVKSFGTLQGDITDREVGLRRIEYYHGLTSLRWIVGGEGLMLNGGYIMASQAGQDMNGSTRSNLMRFVNDVQEFLPAVSLMNAKDLELYF